MAVHDQTPVGERILSVLVENHSGVLSRVVGLFSARGFNIDSLAVGETEDDTMSRITLVTRGDERTIEQIKKQLNKLIDVIKVQDLSQETYIDRELILVKFRSAPEIKEALKALMDKNRIHIIEDNAKIIAIECTETRQKTRQLFGTFKKMGILEIAQTGAVALSKKGPKDL